MRGPGELISGRAHNRNGPFWRGILKSFLLNGP
jgi:hypothetical protein